MGDFMARTNNPSLRRIVERLNHSEERFRLLVESVQDYALFMLDPAGRIASWNHGAERIKGYRAAEVVGRHFSLFYTRDDIDSGKPDAALEQAAASGRFEDVGWRVRKDGSLFWAGVVVTALRDENGKLRGFGKVTHDLTERRQATQQLAQNESRLRSALDHDLTPAFGANPDSPIGHDLDGLINMIARDLQPPLRNIEMLAAQVRDGVAELNAMAQRLDLIAQSAVRLSRVTNDLLMFSRSGRANPAIHLGADLNAIVAEARKALGAAARSRRVRWSIGKLPRVAGDPALLRVAFEQLLSNALKFTQQRDPAMIEVAASAQHDHEVLVEIKDNGIGFDEQHAHKLFRAFQRLHNESGYAGGGLGLITAKRIIECHNGRIWAEARPGAGASFFITLSPVAPEVQRQSPEAWKGKPAA
jgi:PAS domain S-box-containing protein